MYGSDDDEYMQRQGKSKTNYRVLIVEDEDDIRHYIHQELCGEYRIAECKRETSAGVHFEGET